MNRTGLRAAVLLTAMSVATTPVRGDELRSLNNQQQPVLPVPRDVSTFEARWAIDIPIFVASGFITMGWLLSGSLSPTWCAPLCDLNDVWGIDRGAAGNYDTEWQQAGNIVLPSVIAGTLLTLGLTESPLAALEDLFIIAEATLLASATATLTSLATRRPRPYMYSEKASLETRNGGTASGSFFSGHTAVSFAITTSMFNLMRYRYPNSIWPWVTLGVGTSASSMVATSRVLGGNHFPTDVLAGAAVGIAAGFIVPALHIRPDLHIRPVVSNRTIGVAWNWM